MSDHLATFTKIADAIKGAKEILLIAHQKPDGDTLGANLAMANWLRDEGKHFHIFCVHPVPPHYQYLPLWQHVKSTEDELQEIPFDLVIALDSSSLSYAGAEALLGKLKGKPTIVNIDHHGTNPHFGDLNVVDATASSACEVVYRFFTHVGGHVSRDMSTCLLTGILTDTGGFHFSHITPRTFEICRRCTEAGAQPESIARAVYDSST
ncbi:MAG: DHH family phosphoesterase, partial [Patescibacteria group bacterium]